MANAFPSSPKQISPYCHTAAYPDWRHMSFKTTRSPLSALKILMTSDTQGSVWNYTLELAEALNRKGHQVTLATLGQPLSPEQHRQLRRLPRLDVVEGHYRLEGLNESCTDVKAAGQWLLRLEQQLQPHLIHLNGYAHAMLPWQAPKVVAASTCFLSRWQAVKGRSMPPTWAAYRQYVKQSLQAADIVFAPTQTLLSTLQENYGPLPQGQVVPIGRNSSPIHVSQKRPYILTSRQNGDDPQSLLNLDRVAPRLPWPVYIAGENRSVSESTGSLRCVNPLRQLTAKGRRAWFAHAAIYALPTRYEPFGLAVLEAGMAGCALVLGDIPNLREVWGDAALYVPPDDPLALEVTLALLMADTTFRRRMANRAYVRAQKFTSARMVEQYLAHCRELVKCEQKML